MRTYIRVLENVLNNKETKFAVFNVQDVS